MLKHVKNREEEELLLDWALNEAKYLKELIIAFEEYPDEIKKNGEIHKGKQKDRLKVIKDYTKELSELKKFYIARKVPPLKWSQKRYSLKRRIDNGRRHLHQGSNNDLVDGLQHSPKE